jgi:quinol-cytochrome oxidoreductase complex cytochrome b subunit
MSDVANLVSAMAITVLLVFLYRFYRRQIAPGLKNRRLIQTLSGLAVIIASIVLSIWLRKNG